MALAPTYPQTPQTPQPPQAQTPPPTAPAQTAWTPPAQPQDPAKKGPNLDPAYLKEQITNSWNQAHPGQAINPAVLAQQIGYASKPDLYSDNQWRTGWNDYLAYRMNNGTAGASPDMAGTEGIVEAPAGYVDPKTALWGGAGGGGQGQSIWTPDPRSGPLFDMLMGRAKQSLAINPNDPIIRNQANAYGAQQTRANRDYLKQVAESAGPNTNISAERRAGAEKVGQANSAFTADLMGRELTARRQEIQQSLTLGANMLSDEQRMQLQNQLALMDGALGRANLGQRAYEFDTDDEFRRSPLA